MNPTEMLLHEIESQNLWSKQEVFNRNAFIKVAGSVDTKMYFVVSGCLRVFVMDEDVEHTIRFGYKHNVIASLDSFIYEQPSPYYIQAIKKSEVLVLKKSVFTDLLNSNPTLKEGWVQILEQVVVQQLERERDLLCASPEDRYNRVLSRSPQLFQEVPQKYIASYLRMTPETLSRINKS